MKHRYLIGVDLGTSATKAALYTTGGHLVSEASLDVPLYTPEPGVVEQENEDFYRTAAGAVRRCIQESGIDARQVAALAFNSQMAGIGSVDEDFRPATRFDSWLDMRCQPYIQWMEQVAGERVTRLTGCPPTCDHGPKMLWWQHERPAEYARIARFVTPAGYVAGRAAGLSGEQAFIDYTFLHFSGCSDAQAGNWSAELCDLFSIDRARLPQIVEPWRVVGEVTPAAAADFGLAAGTLLAAGCGDTAAGALGAGIVQPGMLFDVAGTAAVLASCTGSFLADAQHRALLTMRSVIPGLWHPLAYIAGGGLALRWYRDTFYNTRRGQPLPPDPELYDEMCAASSAVAPDADGLLFSPHLGGRICPALPEMRGAWVGFSWGHTQAHFFRAILESVALEYAFYLAIMRQQLPELQLSEARVIGGGAPSRVWNQIKASVLNVPYQRLRRAEFGAWGAAMIAGKAAGIFNDLASVAHEHAQREGELALPDPTQSAAYAALFHKYLSLQEMLGAFYKG